MPPAKIVYDGTYGAGEIYDSLICAGSIVSGATVHRSVLSPGVRVAAGAVLDGAILLDDVVVEEGAVVRNAIIDKHVVIPRGARIGVDPKADAERFTVSAAGVVAIAKGQSVT